ncbi:MAG: DUF1192 domain-containing protein [Rhodospirillales bacterium]|nr:DUF1192 domain-containing protein [Rhodospirillales bacterium]
MDLDDLEPRKQKPKPKDLGPYSIEELNDHIATLEAEIARARAAIAAKQAHRSGADVFFKKK